MSVSLKDSSGKSKDSINALNAIIVIHSGKNTKTLTKRYVIKLDNSTPTIFPTQYFPMTQIVKSSSGDILKVERKLTSLLIVSSQTLVA